jgi:hypothetical protein
MYMYVYVPYMTRYSPLLPQATLLIIITVKTIIITPHYFLRLLSISPHRVREISDPASLLLNQLHKVLFIDQLPPSLAQNHVRYLCYVMVPLQHIRQRRWRWGGGLHGIRSVGGGAQPLKQQSGAFRRWPLHLPCLLLLHCSLPPIYCPAYAHAHAQALRRLKLGVRESGSPGVREFSPAPPPSHM